MRKILVLTILLISVGLGRLYAQSEAYLWQRYYFSGKLTDRLALSLEAEHRTLLLSWLSSQTLLPRLSVHYLFKERIQAGMGIAHFLNYAITEKNNRNELERSELRLYQEWKYHQPCGRLRIGQRLRVEERFYVPYSKAEQASVSNSLEYGFRFRYQLGVQIQLTPKLIRTRVFLKLHDELLLQASEFKPDQLFEANRFYGGVEWRFSNAWAVEAGYLTWIELQITNGTYSYFVPYILRVTLQHSLDFRKKHS